MRANTRIVQLLLICVFGAPSAAVAGEILADIPHAADARSHYVIYSHGRIVEGDDAMPVHEAWGTYDFPAIKQRLAADSDFVLIAQHRPLNADINVFADRLESWVRRLTDDGVDPRQITLVGFSKGGEITARAASALRPLPINTILLASCWPGGVQDRESIQLSGRFLSIYETTDSAGSCKAAADRSVGLSSFQEIAITTGRAHGAFFEPLSAWLDPLKQWIEQAAAE